MKLSAQELEWIDERMKTYQITYREIYHEILDHIVTAIEQKREVRDNNSIETLYERVVNEHFGGSCGLENLVIKQKGIYQQRIKKLWMKSFEQCLTWPMLGFTIVTLLLSLTLPDIKLVKALLLIVCILLACAPGLYAYFLLKGRVMKSIEGKQSFLKAHLIAVICAPSGVFGVITLQNPWSFIDYLSPIVFMTVILLFILVNLTAINFCKKFTTLIPVTK